MDLADVKRSSRIKRSTCDDAVWISDLVCWSVSCSLAVLLVPLAAAPAADEQRELPRPSSMSRCWRIGRLTKREAT